MLHLVIGFTVGNDAFAGFTARFHGVATTVAAQLLLAACTRAITLLLPLTPPMARTAVLLACGCIAILCSFVVRFAVAIIRTVCPACLLRATAQVPALRLGVCSPSDNCIGEQAAFVIALRGIAFDIAGD